MTDTKDELLISHLATGKTVTESAALSGMSERTAFRRVRSPGFQIRLLNAYAANVKPSVDRLRAQFDASLDTLVELRDDKESPRAIRLRAAVEILQLIADIAGRYTDDVYRGALASLFNEGETEDAEE